MTIAPLQIASLVPTRYQARQLEPGGILENFLGSLSDKTRAMYDSDLRDFAAWLGMTTRDAAAWYIAQSQGMVNQVFSTTGSSLSSAGFRRRP